MRPHRLAAPALALTAGLALALTGCGNDDPAPVDPTTGAAATSTPATAQPSAAPTEPALPDAATRPTEAGARAFITHYWDLVNYAQVTGDVTALRKASAPSCKGCAGGINVVVDVYKSGGRAFGGAYATDVQKLNQLDLPNPSLASFEALMTATNSEQRIVRGDGTEEILEAGVNHFAVVVLWLGDQWRMDVLEPR